MQELSTNHIRAKMFICTNGTLLKLATTVGYAVCLCFLGIGVATNHWVHSMEQYEMSTPNGTIVMKILTHSGLWKLCPLSVIVSTKPLESWKASNKTEKTRRMNNGADMGCQTIEYFTPIPMIDSDTTTAVARLIREAAPFPCVSLISMIIGTVIGILALRDPNRKHWTFVAGVIYITAGLTLVVGIIIYLTNITDVLSDIPDQEGHVYRYKYGYSFILVALSFALSEVCGVMCMYLYIQRHKESDENEGKKQIVRCRRYSERNTEENAVSNRLVERCPEVMIPA
ncbi:voltage-dependent calcium channel gamma-5 subunit-like [Ptychodera flava]|uniref:voltage-dependent calcium channel gamma-5 subunit-like n=1 Tax=Ptychodera flava TaxID=63121 RepID=UPI00396AA96F